MMPARTTLLAIVGYIAATIAAPTTQNSTNITSTGTLGNGDYSFSCQSLPRVYQAGNPNTCRAILDGILEWPSRITFTNGLSRHTGDIPIPLSLSSQAFQHGGGFFLTSGNSGTIPLATTLANTTSRAYISARDSSAESEVEASTGMNTGDTIDECVMTVRFDQRSLWGTRETFQLEEFHHLITMAWQDCMEGQLGRIAKIEALGKEMQLEIRAVKGNAWPPGFGQAGPALNVTGDAADAK